MVELSLSVRIAAIISIQCDLRSDARSLLNSSDSFGDQRIDCPKARSEDKTINDAKRKGYGSAI